MTIPEISLLCILKEHFKVIFSFSANVNTSLKFLWAIKKLSEGAQALGHSESTRALKALVHLVHLATKALECLGTWDTLLSRLEVNMTQKGIKCKGVPFKNINILEYWIMKQQLSINFLMNYPLLWLVKTRLNICIMIFHPLLH